MLEKYGVVYFCMVSAGVVVGVVVLSRLLVEYSWFRWEYSGLIVRYWAVVGFSLVVGCAATNHRILHCAGLLCSSLQVIVGKGSGLDVL